MPENNSNNKELIDGLNEDLAAEYQAVIMYRTYASLVSGPWRVRSVYEYGATGARANGVATPSAYTARVPVESTQYEFGLQPGSRNASVPCRWKSADSTFFPKYAALHAYWSSSGLCDATKT